MSFVKLIHSSFMSSRLCRYFKNVISYPPLAEVSRSDGGG
jgi:hypothetical protein